MSRTTQCLCAAALLSAISLGLMVVRFNALNHDGASGNRFFQTISLELLPPADQSLVEVLLLLPVAALIICFVRNVIGLTSFGTFTPALLGLAFRDPRSWPGIIVFVGILLAGWGLRRALNRFHLLQAPRISLVLTLVVIILIGFIVLSHRIGWPATQYISLFPLIILTGMIERFITVEEEDGPRASFQTLFSTMLVALCIALVVGRSFVANHLLRYPETLGFVMAALMLLGRYTGFRLTELYRFRELARQSPAEHEMEPAMVWTGSSTFGSHRF